MGKRKKKHKNGGWGPKLKYVIGGVVLVLVVLYIIGSNVTEYSVECEDVLCFIEKANACTSVVLDLQMEKALYRFESYDCVLTKTILKLNPYEDIEMQNLLNGKTMYCEYVKGGFNNNWIDSDIKGIQSCTGELKDIVMQLMVFV